MAAASHGHWWLVVTSDCSKMTFAACISVGSWYSSPPPALQIISRLQRAGQFGFFFVLYFPPCEPRFLLQFPCSSWQVCADGVRVGVCVRVSARVLACVRVL